VEVPHDPEVIPGEDRLSGEHITAAFQYSTDSGTDEYAFSRLGKKKTTLTALPKTYESVKKAILALPEAELKKKSSVKPVPVPKKPGEKVKKVVVPKAPRAQPRKPRTKKLVSRSKGKKAKKSTKE
ncbi:MAG: hypothetical protein HXY34_12755, partial [Candidatus Thorarchaeota archaeon]|nr:hypothetical protein [Candidatus Thorarchaeota archaeon]